MRTQSAALAGKASRPSPAGEASRPSPAGEASRPSAAGSVVLAGAASESVRALLAGPRRPARVLADFGRVAYLDVGGELLALAAPGAVRLPFSVVLAGPLPPLAPPATGDEAPIRVGGAADVIGGAADVIGGAADVIGGAADVIGGRAVPANEAVAVVVGGGGVRVGDVTVEVRRWWRPPTPRPRHSAFAPAPASGRAPASAPGHADHDAGVVSRLAKALERHDRREEEAAATAAYERRTATTTAAAAYERRTTPDVAARAGRLEGALSGRGDARAAVERLVGRGPGLTPAGDDVLAGALLASHGTAVGARLRGALPADLERRTTALAAALVRAAARGEGTPEGVALVDAVRGHDDLDAALRALLALGHSSGVDTALGILVAARAVRSTEEGT